MRSSFFGVFILLVACVFITGCTASGGGNRGQLQTYSYRLTEPDWIRNGEPIEFEGQMWYPVDGIETFLDSEMILVGDHLGTEVFVDRIDVRPYDRLYTKFGKHKFRYFKKRKSND